MKSDSTKITELENYDIREIIEVALTNQLYDSLIMLFKPITINGEIKIYFDAFSTDILQIIEGAYETKERAEEMAKEIYSNLSDEEKQRDSVLDEIYAEEVSSKFIIPKEVKDTLKKSLFTINWEMISKMKIKNSHSRQISGWCHSVNSVEDVTFYSEDACLPTCIELFNKNIRTTMNDTDGVFEDSATEGICTIWLDYTSLSDENKMVIEELISSGVAERFLDTLMGAGKVDTVSIFVPCSSEETVGEVSDKLQKIALKFKKQDILYGRGTPEEVYQKYIPVLEKMPYLADAFFDGGVTIEGIIALLDYFGIKGYYDEEEGLIWDSYNLYRKHKEYIESLTSSKSFH